VASQLKPSATDIEAEPPERLQSGSDPSEPKNGSPGRFKKRWLLYLLLLIALGPYLFFRASSFSRKIKAFELETTVPAAVFDGTLRVATWNIAHGRGATLDNWAGDGESKQERLKEISKLIVEMDADIVVLNEVDYCSTWSGGYDQAATIAQQTGYRYMVKQSNLDFGFIYGRWHFGNVLLSRYPVSDVEVVEFAPLNQWESWVVGCKRGLTCTVELSPENSVSVIGLHLESRNETVRVEEAFDVNRVASRLENPIVVAGDLNTAPPEAPQSNTSVDGRNAFEELVNANVLSYSPALAPSAAELTFPAFAPATTIDWVLFEEFNRKSFKRSCRITCRLLLSCTLTGYNSSKARRRKPATAILHPVATMGDCREASQ